MDSTVLLKKLLEKYIKKVMSGEPVSPFLSLEKNIIITKKPLIT